LQSPKEKYRLLVIVLAAMIIAGLPLEFTEKMFGRKSPIRRRKSLRARVVEK
jgi:hypothetical protein